MSISERAKKLSKHDQIVINRVADYQSCFNSVEGRRILLDLIDNGFLFRPTNIVGDSDGSLINEGKRSLVLYILAQLETNAKDLLDRVTKSREEAEKYYDFED